MEASKSTGTPWSKPEFAPAPESGTVSAAAQSPTHANTAESDAFAERPEVYVGAAFAGGLVVAGLLRWIGR